MTTDLRTQLRGFAQELSSDLPTIGVDEILAAADLGRSQVEPEATRRALSVQPRRWVLAAAAAVMVGVLIGGTAWLTRSGTPDPAVVAGAALDVTKVAIVDPVPPSAEMIEAGGSLWLAHSGSITRVDPWSGEVTDSIPIERTEDLVAAPDSVWALSLPDTQAATEFFDGTVSRIDLATGRVTDMFEFEFAWHTGTGWGGRLLAAQGAVWVTHSTGVDRIDLNTLDVDTISYPEAERVTETEGRVWVGELKGALWLHAVSRVGGGQTLTQLDLSSRQLDDLHVEFESRPETTAVLADNAIWFFDGHDRNMARFDLESHELTELPKIGQLIGLGVYADEAFWVPGYPCSSDPVPEGDGCKDVTDRSPGIVTRIDEVTSEVTDVIDIPYIGSVTVDGESLWVNHWERGRISRIDIATRQLTHIIDVGGDPWKLLPFDGALWVVLDDRGVEPQTIIRLEYP